ncbi:MAG: hypothetical protein R3275_05320 [Saprospiraceae bacterium]|nr:hypothetical protein [Saprospiraceae bacterium]
MTKIQQKPPEWNEKEFLAFILLYAANLDMEYRDEEKKLIQELLDKEHYVKVRDVYRELNDHQCLQLIQEYKGWYFPTAERTEVLLSKLDELFEADGDYSNLESACRHMLHRLL